MTDTKRRRLLLASGAGLATVLAGCTGGDDDDDDGPEDEEAAGNGDDNGDGDENGSENGGDDDSDDGDDDIPGQRLDDDDRVDLLEHSISDGTVSGSVKNVSDEKLPALSVHVYYFDDEPVEIGDATDQTSGLEPGTTWDFSLSYDGDADEVAEYKVELVVDDGS